jgi:hypothetical protein
MNYGRLYEPKDMQKKIVKVKEFILFQEMTCAFETSEITHLMIRRTTKLIPWNSVLPEKLIVARNFPPLLKPIGL